MNISTDYKHTIDSSAIKHVINKHSAPKELLRGQLPITDSDFESIENIVSNYDSIEVSKTKTGLDAITYSKSTEMGDTLYVEEVRTGRKELATVTMYKIKNSALTDETLQKSSSYTPEATSDLGTVSSGKDTNNSDKNNGIR